MFNQQTSPFFTLYEASWQAFSTYLAGALRMQGQLGIELGATAGRMANVIVAAKIPEDVIEAALREQEGLARLGMDVVRAQVRASSELVHGQYAGLVHAEAVPRSLLQSGGLGKTLASSETAVLSALTLVEDARRKLVEPFGFPAARAKPGNAG